MSSRVTVAVALVLVLASASAQAALPSVHSLGAVRPTPSGVVDSRYPDGDDGTTAIPLLWGNCPSLATTTAASDSFDLRTLCALIEPGSPDATLSLLAGTLPSGCSVSGNGIACTTPTVGSASVTVRATRNTDTADTGVSITVTTAGTDSTAPTIPLGLTAVDNADGTGSLTWDASSDPSVSGIATGVESYRVQKSGVTQATVTAPSANVQPALTQTRIGSADSEASSQSGADWTMTFGGAGLASTADHILGRFAQITGDFTATTKVTSFTPVSGTTGSIGIAVRASTDAGAIAAYARWRDSDDKCNLRYRGTTSGAAANGTVSSAYTLPVWIKMTRASDTFTAYCSTDGNTWTATSSVSVSPGATAYVGPFVTNGTASSTATGVAAQVNVHQGAQVSHTISGSGSYTVSAYDGTTRSSESAAVTATVTGGAGGSSLITVPTVTQTVCLAGPPTCDFVPAQLASIASSADAASSNGIAAGTVLELQTAVAGVPEEWAARIVVNGVSGESGNPIWVVVREGDIITFDTTTPGNVGLIDITDGDYWLFAGSRDGGVSAWELGDETQHTPQCAQYETGSAYGCYAHSRTVMVRSSTGVGFYGMTLHGANDHDSTVVDNDSSRILFKNIEWSYDGHNAYNTNKNGTLGDSGDTDTKDMAHISASRSVMQNMYAHHNGHVQPLSGGPWQVWRQLAYDGNWLDHTTSPEFTGNHAATFLPGANRPDYNTTTRFGPLIEDSLFYGAGSEPEHKVYQDSIQFLGRNIIFRDNFVVQRSGVNTWERIAPQAMSHCATATTQAVLRHEAFQYFNNTVYGGFVGNTSASLGGSVTGHDADTCANYRVKNNLFQGQVTGTKRGSSMSDAADDYTVRWATPGDYTGYSDLWKNAQWYGNIFGKHPTDPASATFYKVNVYAPTGSGGAGAGTQALNAAVDANGDYDCADGGDTAGLWPSSWCGNLDSQLLFVGDGTATTSPVTTGPTDQSIDRTTLRNRLALHTSASYGIGDAWPMTRVATADGGSGTTLVLDDARWIYDGWDIDEYTWDGMHQEYPDCIAIGATVNATAASATVVQVATATDINYTTHTVTLASGVTRVDGSPVWPATRNSDGSCGAVWDNRGAAQ